MKLRIVLLLAPLAALLSGCIGSNYTLFTTKSNIGLNMDVVEPVLEVAVNRKEFVVAPSFDQGQTPPVMGSFSPSVGARDSFRSFFLGADQTFAGGDAAVAMATLYGDPTPKTTDMTQFDSSFPLADKPDLMKSKNKLKKATSPFREGQTAPFIFGTDTALGFKVNWTTAADMVPDAVRLGYNRREIALAPIHATELPKPNGAATDKTPVSIQMPSFLATIEASSAVRLTNSGTRGIQYFATGKAATQLARQRDVRVAMLKRMDPEQKLTGLQGQQGEALTGMLQQLDAGLDNLRNGPPADLEAGRQLDLLNAEADKLGLPAQFGDGCLNRYNFVRPVGGAPVYLEINQSPDSYSHHAWADVTGYRKALYHSIASLEEALSELNKQQPVNLEASGPAVTPPQAVQLRDQRDKQKAALLKLDGAVQTSDVVRRAYDYWFSKLPRPTAP